MKKQIYPIIASMFLFPLAASAGYIGSGEMVIGYSTPAAGGYYADYDKISYARTSGAEIVFASHEVFCVEHDDLISPTIYDFYSSDGDEAPDLLSTWLANYAKVTWIANWATTTTSFSANNYSYTEDEIKAIGQVAIWITLGVLNNVSSYNYYDDLTTQYNAASDQSDYVNDWLFASSYSVTDDGSTIDGQNYLVKAAPAPVPEPSTLLLLGTGLVGLASNLKRKRNKTV